MSCKRGYTILELVIVIAIITLFCGLTFAYFNSFSDRYAVEQEAQKLADILELAKVNSSAAEVPSNKCPVDTHQFKGYFVSFPNTTSYVLGYSCTGMTDEQIPPYNPYNLKNASLITSQTQITFPPLNGMVTDCTLGCSIKISGNGICRAVTVNVTGGIAVAPCP